MSTHSIPTTMLQFSPPPKKKKNSSRQSTPSLTHHLFFHFHQFHIINPNHARNELCFLLLPCAREYQVPRGLTARSYILEDPFLPTCKQGAFPPSRMAPGMGTDDITNWAAQHSHDHHQCWPCCSP